MKALAVAVAACTGNTPAVAIGFSLARNLIGWEEYGGPDPLEVRAYATSTALTAPPPSPSPRRTRPRSPPSSRRPRSPSPRRAGNGVGLSAGGMWTDNSIATQHRGRHRRPGDRRQSRPAGRHSTSTATDAVTISADAQAAAVAASLGGGKGGAVAIGLSLAHNTIDKRSRPTSRAAGRHDRRRRRRDHAPPTPPRSRAHSVAVAVRSAAPAARSASPSAAAALVDQHHPHEGRRLPCRAATSARGAAGGASPLTATSTARSRRRSPPSPRRSPSAARSAVGVAIGVSVSRNFIGWDPHGTTSFDHYLRRQRADARARQAGRGSSPESATGDVYEYVGPSFSVPFDHTSAQTPAQLVQGDVVKRLAGPGHLQDEVYEYMGAATIANANLATQDYSDGTLWRRVTALQQDYGDTSLWKLVSLGDRAAEVRAFAKDSSIAAAGALSATATGTQTIVAVVVQAPSRSRPAARSASPPAVPAPTAKTDRVRCAGVHRRRRQRCDHRSERHPDGGQRVHRVRVLRRGVARGSAGGKVGVAVSIGLSIAINEVDNAVEATSRTPTAASRPRPAASSSPRPRAAGHRSRSPGSPPLSSTTPRAPMAPPPTGPRHRHPRGDPAAFAAAGAPLAATDTVATAAKFTTLNGSQPLEKGDLVRIKATLTTASGRQTVSRGDRSSSDRATTPRWAPSGLSTPTRARRRPRSTSAPRTTRSRRPGRRSPPRTARSTATSAPTPPST